MKDNVILILFFCVLFFASVKDIKTRKVSNRTHICIFLLSLIKGIVILDLMALVIIPMPFLIIEIIKGNQIGGGDIKLIGICSLFLGFKYAYLGVFISLVLVLVINIIRNKTKEKISLVPYLSLGYLLSILVF